MAYTLQHSDSFSGKTGSTSAVLARPAASRRDEAVAGEDHASDELGLLPRRVTRNEIIYTTNQLAIMVETGVTLSAALEGIVKDEQNPTLRFILNDLRKAVEEGEDFSTALARHPR
jgi:type II secretory pathway component PulF